MFPLRLLCPGAGQRILHKLFQRGLRSSVCLEGSGSQMNDEDPVVIEREYKKYMKGNTAVIYMDVRGWSEKLATDSEAVIKAERHVRNQSFASLQKESLDALREAAIIDTFCADCEPVPYPTSTPVRQWKGLRPIARILKRR